MTRSRPPCGSSPRSVQVGLPKATLMVANGFQQQTDGGGLGVIVSDNPATLPLRVQHPNFSSARPRSASRCRSATVAHPSTHDMAAFEEFSEDSRPAQRWTGQSPVAGVDHRLDYSGATFGFREYPVTMPDRPEQS